MTDKILPFSGPTCLDIPAEKVLRAALDARVAHAVIVGEGADGSFYFASGVADAGHTLLLLEKAKKQLLDLVDERT